VVAALALAGALLTTPDAHAVDIPDECFTPTCPYEVVELTDGLDFPVAMDFLPDGRLLIAQKDGTIVQWDGNTLEDWGAIPREVSTAGERGLLGLDVDPKFNGNRRVYLYYTRETATGAIPTIAYFRETNAGVVSGFKDVLPLPEQLDADATNHLAGNLHMRGDYIYVSVGEYGDPANAEDRDVPMGKILKLRRSGLAAPNNPWAGAPGGWDDYVWARGLRNSFDFTFIPGTSPLWATENGPGNCDEINEIKAGRNYGWSGALPSSGGTCYPGRGQQAEVNPHTDSAGVQPWTDGSPIAPTGITVYTANEIPGWQGDLFYCSWVEGKMRHASLSGGVITGQSKIDEADCTTDVIQSPDGELWFLDVELNGDGTLYAIVPSEN
jgi:glucose/arabinose dehydrogenase